jgi:hypothetical protein
MSKEWYIEYHRRFADSFSETTEVHVAAKADKDLLAEMARRLHIELVILLSCTDLPTEAISPARHALEQAEREVTRLAEEMRGGAS